MTNFLIRIFIGKNADPADVKVRSRFASLAGFTGILCNVLLFIGKLTLGLLSASVAIIADAFNNISDAGSAIVTLIGFRLANKPVDKEHPLGHGRLEYVSGFIVDMLIILVGFELFKSSIEKIVSPTLPVVGVATLIVLGVAILVKLWLAVFNRRLGTLIASPALTASAADSRNDVISTGAVLAAMLITHFTKVDLDGFMGAAVALFIL